MKTYKVNEYFLSVQGEGVRAGTVNVFLRFALCNLHCDMEPSPTSPGGWRCDTEFQGYTEMTAAEIVERITEIAGPCRNVIFTGGEPALSVTRELIDALHESGFFLSIETNGTLPLPEGIDFVTASPKTAEHTLRLDKANEVKYVRHHGQALPKPRIKAEHYLISPAWSSDGLHKNDLEWCMNLIKEDPKWRLSLQTHKWLQVR